MLTLSKISTEYDRVPMLRDISLKIEKGQLVCLLGSNGAGKTTTVKTILGLVKPSSGEIRFEEMPLAFAKTNQRIAQGIAVVPEGRRLFAKMTVRENLCLGAFFVRNKQELEARMDKVFQLFPRLKSRLGQTAGTLSGGEQSMAAIGRGMMGRPKLLLLTNPLWACHPNSFRNILRPSSASTKKKRPPFYSLNKTRPRPSILPIAAMSCKKDVLSRRAPVRS